MISAWDVLPTHVTKTILSLIGFVELPTIASVPRSEIRPIGSHRTKYIRSFDPRDHNL